MHRSLFKQSKRKALGRQELLSQSMMHILGMAFVLCGMWRKKGMRSKGCQLWGARDAHGQGRSFSLCRSRGEHLQTPLVRREGVQQPQPSGTLGSESPERDRRTLPASRGPTAVWEHTHVSCSGTGVSGHDKLKSIMSNGDWQWNGGLVRDDSKSVTCVSVQQKK